MDFTAPGTTAPDADFDALEEMAGEPTSILARLEADLTTEVAEPAIFAVTGRPGYSVRFRTDFTEKKDLGPIRKLARDKNAPGGIDGVRFASLLLGRVCQAIRLDGHDLDLADLTSRPADAGKPVTFGTREFQRIIGGTNVDETVRKLYGLEGHILSTSNRVMDAAGYGDETDTEGPTE